MFVVQKKTKHNVVAGHNALTKKNTHEIHMV